MDLFLEDIKGKSKEEILIIIERWIWHPAIILDSSDKNLKALENKIECLFSSNEEFYPNYGLLKELEEFSEVLNKSKIKRDLHSFDIIKSILEKCIKNYSKVDYSDDGVVVFLYSL